LFFFSFFPLLKKTSKIHDTRARSPRKKERERDEQKGWRRETMLTRKSKHDREFAIYRFVCDHVDIFRRRLAPLLSISDLKRLRSTNKALKRVVDSVGFSMFDENGDYVLEKVSSYTRTEQVDWAWEIWKAVFIKDFNYSYALVEKHFCWRVAKTNSLGLLQHVRDVLKLNWDWQTAATAAEIGNLEMLKYCYAHGCAFNEDNEDEVCTFAAANGHLECLKYLHRTVKAPWSESSRIATLLEFCNGNDACLACFQYMRRNGCPRHEDEDEIGVSDDELCWENDENEEWYQYFVENDW